MPALVDRMRVIERPGMVVVPDAVRLNAFRLRQPLEVIGLTGAGKTDEDDKLGHVMGGAP